eukprot:scaffold17427_cov54-Cylindrotheca_fusiformis.AAC.3
MFCPLGWTFGAFHDCQAKNSLPVSPGSVNPSVMLMHLHPFVQRDSDGYTSLLETSMALQGPN